MTAIEDKYRYALQALLPRGPSWTREEDAELTKLLQGLAIEFSRVELRGIDLLEEIDPRTTTELLSDWERVLDIANDCGTPTTTADRRLAVWNKLLGFGDPNLAFWQEQAEALGFTFNEIREYRPFSAGDDAGDHCVGVAWAFAWVLDVVTRSLEMNTLLQCVIDSISPSHTVAEVFAQPYSDTPKWNAFTHMGGSDPKCICHNGSYWVCGQASGRILMAQTLAWAGSWSTKAAAGGYTGDWAACVDASHQLGTNSFVIVGASGEIQYSDSGGAMANAPPAGGYAGDFTGITARSALWVFIVGTGAEVQQVRTDTWAATAYTAAGGYAGDFTGCVACPAGETYADRVVLVGTGGEIQVYDYGTWGPVLKQATAGEGYTDDWKGVAWAQGFFWAYGENGELQQSEEGLFWRRIPNSFTTTLLGLISDQFEGVLIGDNGGGNEIFPRTRVGPEMLVGASIQDGSDLPPDFIGFAFYQYFNLPIMFVLGADGSDPVFSICTNPYGS